MKLSNLIALCALIVSAGAFWLSLSSNASQREHMRLSVTPIPSMHFIQTPDRLLVELQNVGTGPMILQKIEYLDSEGDVARTLISSNEFDIGASPDVLVFELDSEGALGAGIGQLLLGFDPDPENRSHQERNQSLRAHINDKTITVIYTDVYGSDFEPYQYELVSRNIDAR